MVTGTTSSRITSFTTGFSGTIGSGTVLESATLVFFNGVWGKNCTEDKGIESFEGCALSKADKGSGEVALIWFSTVAAGTFVSPMEAALVLLSLSKGTVAVDMSWDMGADDSAWGASLGRSYAVDFVGSWEELESVNFVANGSSDSFSCFKRLFLNAMRS